MKIKPAMTMPEKSNSGDVFRVVAIANIKLMLYFPLGVCDALSKERPMTDEFIKQFADILGRTDHKCPFLKEPVVGGFLVHRIPQNEKGLWVLAAALDKAGFRSECQMLTSMMGRQTIAKIESGVLSLSTPEYHFCSDWCVYSTYDDG